MRGNVSTAERSSIGRSIIIGEIASQPKPRKKLKRPPRDAWAGRHRGSLSHLSVSTMNGPEFLDGFPAGNCLWTMHPSQHSTIDQRISQSFLSCPGPSRTDPNRLFTWQCEGLSVASSARPGTRLVSFTYGFSFAFGMALVRYMRAQSKTLRFAVRGGVWIAFLYRGSGEIQIRGDDREFADHVAVDQIVAGSTRSVFPLFREDPVEVPMIGCQRHGD